MLKFSCGVSDDKEGGERYGVTEYWWFDPSGGEYHYAALTGDRLVDGVYEPIAIETLGDGRLREYSERWGCTCVGRMAELRLFEPVTESYFRSHDEECAGRMAEQSCAEQERVSRLAAESRVVELEADLRQLRGE